MFPQNVVASGASGMIAPTPTTATARSRCSFISLPSDVRPGSRPTPVERVGNAVHVAEQPSLRSVDASKPDDRLDVGRPNAVVTRAEHPLRAALGHGQRRS